MKFKSFFLWGVLFAICFYQRPSLQREEFVFVWLSLIHYIDYTTKIQTMENIDIVSVCIITYNSSKYIEETLESVRRQTYPAIELIISDDASSDDTVYICEQWIAKIVLDSAMRYC